MCQYICQTSGPGKTFFISLILATIHSRSEIALSVTSFGIAATLLEWGRTALSALQSKLILKVTYEPILNILKNSAMAKVLKTCNAHWSLSIALWKACVIISIVLGRNDFAVRRCPSSAARHSEITYRWTQRVHKLLSFVELYVPILILTTHTHC